MPGNSHIQGRCPGHTKSHWSGICYSEHQSHREEEGSPCGIRMPGGYSIPQLCKMSRESRNDTPGPSAKPPPRAGPTFHGWGKEELALTQAQKARAASGLAVPLPTPSPPQKRDRGQSAPGECIPSHRWGPFVPVGVNRGQCPYYSGLMAKSFLKYLFFKSRG